MTVIEFFTQCPGNSLPDGNPCGGGPFCYGALGMPDSLAVRTDEHRASILRYKSMVAQLQIAVKKFVGGNKDEMNGGKEGGFGQIAAGLSAGIPLFFS